jgi:hypothetical protein
MDEVVRKKHGIEIKALQASQVHPRDAKPVTGNSDETNHSLLSGLDESLDGAPGAMRRVPLVIFNQVVELNQVQPIHAEAMEGALKASPGTWAGALPSLRGEEEVVPVGGHPWRNPQFGIAIGRRGIDMVYPKLKEGGEDLVGIVLGDSPYTSGTKDHPAAAMPGAPKIS